MRLAVFNWSNRLAGGAETYIGNVLHALGNQGVDVALLHEVDGPVDRLPLLLPPQSPTWDVAALGLQDAIRGLAEWKPTVIFGHGSLDPAVERAVFKVAPSVAFIHNYYGTCISGSKTFRFPTTTPCSRVFGYGCLACFLPRRCGGLNPLTMLQLFRRQAERLRNLRLCRLLITHTEHMRHEYLRHGFPADGVVRIKFCVAAPKHGAIRVEPSQAPHRLLFLGRMDHLKGGHVLLDALPTVAERLGRNVTLTLAGDGPMRRSWQHQAELIVRKDPRIQIIFPGWVGEEARVALFHKHDLLIMPSLWPEPFGQVGIEAGHFGLPSVAFARGGTSDWLIDGKNGYRALGTPSMALGLADTILRCLQDEGHYSELTEGARKVSLEFDVRTHMRSLLGLLERVGQESAA